VLHPNNDIMDYLRNDSEPMVEESEEAGPHVGNVLSMLAGERNGGNCVGRRCS
jgi:hypothetical protein